MTYNLEAEGSNPTGFWTFFSLSNLCSVSFIQVPRSGALQLIFLFKIRRAVELEAKQAQCAIRKKTFFKKLLLGLDFASLFLTQRFVTFQHVSSGSSPSKAGGNEHLLHKVSLKFVTPCDIDIGTLAELSYYTS